MVLCCRTRAKALVWLENIKTKRQPHTGSNFLLQWKHYMVGSSCWLGESTSIGDPITATSVEVGIIKSFSSLQQQVRTEERIMHSSHWAQSVRRKHFWSIKLSFADEQLFVTTIHLFEMGQIRSLFVYFCPILNAMPNRVQNLTINGKSIDRLLGIQTPDCRMLGADKSIELWWPHLYVML